MSSDNQIAATQAPAAQAIEQKLENWIEPHMPSELKAKALEILSEFDLYGLRVRHTAKTGHITFTQDRRVVDVPLVLLDGQHWKEIRYLFRAVLGSAPGAWNMSAENNEWSAFKK